MFNGPASVQEAARGYDNKYSNIFNNLRNIQLGGADGTSVANLWPESRNPFFPEQNCAMKKGQKSHYFGKGERRCYRNLEKV
jgi:hypothetical protein